MESIFVALITVVIPLLIPLIISRHTLIKADNRDKELQELAISLSMPDIAELIEQRRRRRLMRDAVFRGARRMSLLAMAYGIFFFGLSLFIIKENQESESPGFLESWIPWILFPLSIICVLVSYYMLTYPTSAIRKMSRIDTRERDSRKVLDRIRELTDESKLIRENALAEKRELTPDEAGKLEGIYQLMSEYNQLYNSLLSAPPGVWSKLWGKLRKQR